MAGMIQAPRSRRSAARFFAGAFVLAGLGANAAPAREGTEPSPSPASRDAALRTDFEPAATLALRLVDAGTWGVLPGCVRIAAAEGGGWLDLDADLEARARGLGGEFRALGWHVLAGEVEIRIPAGRLEIEAFSGLEFDRAALTVEAEADAEARLRVELPLRRLFDAGAAGWVAGNTHLHLRSMTREEADRYLVEVSLADGLEVVFLSYLERALVDRDYTSNAYTR